ncbi:MAG: hypothetical protein ACOCW2_01745 [Chitinivibrionales bacterium]
MAKVNQTQGRSTPYEPETVLDLYDRAYEFHYEKKQPAKAARIYKEIITKFPSSNECAYAAIQLEKITAGKVLKKAEAQMKGRVPVWLVVVLILNLLATVVVGAAFLSYISADVESLVPVLGSVESRQKKAAHRRSVGLGEKKTGSGTHGAMESQNVKLPLFEIHSYDAQKARVGVSSSEAGFELAKGDRAGQE